MVFVVNIFVTSTKNKQIVNRFLY